MILLAKNIEVNIKINPTNLDKLPREPHKREIKKLDLILSRVHKATLKSMTKHGDTWLVNEEDLGK